MLKSILTNVLVLLAVVIFISGIVVGVQNSSFMDFFIRLVIAAVCCVAAFYVVYTMIKDEQKVGELGIYGIYKRFFQKKEEVKN